MDTPQQSPDSQRSKTDQMQALNEAVKVAGITARVESSAVVEQIMSTLTAGEVPERVLVVEYKGHKDACWMVATDQRLMLLYPKMFSKQRNVLSLDYKQLTDVEWKPGMANHRITLCMGRKQEVCHASWLAGQDRGRELVEHLRSKIPQAAHTSAMTPQASKARQLEEFVYNLDPVTKSGIGKVDFEYLASILDPEEMPERMIGAAYDPRAGHSYRFRLEANADLKPGTLVATINRLVFTHKPTLGKPHTVSIAYETIEDVTHTTGRVWGSVSAWVNGMEQKFDKIDQGKVAGWVRYIQQHANLTQEQPGPGTEVPPHTVEAYLRRLDKAHREALLDGADPQLLADLLEPGELVEQIHATVYTDDYILEVHNLPGVVVRTDQRLVFFSNFHQSTPYWSAFAYSDIDSIDHTRGRFMGSITIGVAQGTSKFDSLPDGEVEEWIQCIQERAGLKEAPQQPQQTVTQQPPSRLDELKKLGELRDSGVLTDDEFEAEKARLLSS